MADHLRLPAISEFHTKRRPPSPGEKKFDHRFHATTLRGILEGLESGSVRVFPSSAPPDDDDEVLGRIVLKFETSTALSSLGLFTKASMIPLGTNGSKDFYALTDAESRLVFKQLVDDYGADPDGFPHAKSWKKALSQVTGVTLYDVEDRRTGTLPRLEPDELGIVEVALWPTSFVTRGAEKEAAARLAEVQQLIEEHADRNPRISILVKDERSDTLSLRVRTDGELLDQLLENVLVERIYAPMGLTLRKGDLQKGPAPSSPPIPQGAAIGIIDDLVMTSNPWLDGVVLKSKSFVMDGATATTHGNLTAGIAAYGDLSRAVSGKPMRPPQPIYSARILQADSNGSPTAAGDIAELMEQAIRWLAGEGARIIVCPFARDIPDDGALPDRLSALVDELARSLNVVVVASAGNINDVGSSHWHKDYPAYLREAEAKIAAPATAASALTVSATAHSNTLDVNSWPYAQVVAKTGQVSPFSRTGPSRGINSAGTRKPELTGPGGNYAWDNATSSVLKGGTDLGVVSLSPGRQGRYFEVSTGTSLAAPWVAHQAALIATRYPHAGPNLIRALTALSAKPPKGGTPTDESFVPFGYGTPWADRILESAGNMAILVGEYEMDTGTAAAIPLPIPERFATGASHRIFRVALAFDPPVKRSRRDYLAGRMEFDFIRNHPLDELKNIFRPQPTEAELESDSQLKRWEKPKGPKIRPPMEPNLTTLKSNTLVVRTFERPENGWEPDDHDYHLVVTHIRSQWSETQQREYPRQRFAVAIQLIDVGRQDLPLHDLVAFSLRNRIRTTRR